ncbi:MAG: hypothetical protein N3A58_07410 [Spirochaetes bacterium]|nr:hypothetical protein [Spirochaetota bacterium]
MKNILKNIFEYTLFFLIYIISFSILFFIIWIILEYKNIFILSKVSTNFNIIKYIILKLDYILFEIIPLIFFFTYYTLSFYYINKGSLNYFIFILTSCIVISIIFFILFGALFNSPIKIIKITKSISFNTKKEASFFPSRKIINKDNTFFYLENSNRAILLEENKLSFYNYYYDYKNFQIVFENNLKINIFGEELKFNFPYIDKIVKKYYNNFNAYLNIYHNYIIKNYNPLFFIYFFSLILFFLFIPPIIFNDHWQFFTFFIGIIICIFFIILFLFTFKFTNLYLIDLKSLKSYIFYFPAIVAIIIDIFVILIASIKTLQRNMRMKIGKNINR